MAYIQFIYILPICIIFIAIQISILRHHLQSDSHQTSQRSTHRELQQIHNDAPIINISTIPLRCRQSIFEIWNKCCINDLFSVYLDEIGFKFEYKTSAKSHLIPNIKLIKIANIKNVNHSLCPGLRIQSNAASMVKSQTHASIHIDLMSLYHKSSLYSTVKQYAAINDIDSSFLPTTYRLDNKYERRQFFQSLPCDDDHNHLWLFKTNDHSGSGIHLIDNPLIMRRLFWRDTDIEYAMQYVTQFEYDCNNEYISRFDAQHIVTQLGFNVYIASRNNLEIAYAVRKHVIAQEFIANPLLIHSRKFHLRVFVLVASLNPYIVLYGDGFLILAAHEYDKKHITQQNAITNRAVSREIDDGTNWSLSFQEFERYLNNKQITNINIQQIKQEIKSIVNVTFLSAVKQSQSNQRTRIHSSSYQYAWFALDLLLCDNGEIKLLEVQNAPKTTVIPKDCTINEEEEAHWACVMGKSIAKETVDIAIYLAYCRIKQISIKKQKILKMINYYQLIVYNDFQKDTENVRYATNDAKEYYHEFEIGEF